MISTIYNFGDELSVRENFFLTKVLQKYWAYESRGEDDPFSYIPYADKRIIFGRDPNKKIQKLINKGYVQEKVIGETYWKNKITGYVPLKKHYTLKKVSEKQIDNYYMKKQNELSELHYSVFKSISNGRIDIDTKSWRKCVESAYLTFKPKNLMSADVRSGKKQPTSKRQYKSKMNAVYKQIHFWNNCSKREKVGTVDVDEFGNRFHSVFSRIPKNVRKEFVTICGEKTTEIDLSQSQPTILAKILQELIGNNSFSDAIKNGEYIYELLGNDRNSGGKEFNYSVFGKGVSRKFKQTFPDVIETIRFLKKETEEGFKSHSGLARKLQRYESEIFSAIWKELLTKRIIFIPCHDSIVIRYKDYVTVRIIMEKELRKHFTHFNLK